MDSALVESADAYHGVTYGADHEVDLREYDAVWGEIFDLAYGHHREAIWMDCDVYKQEILTVVWEILMVFCASSMEVIEVRIYAATMVGTGAFWVAPVDHVVCRNRSPCRVLGHYNHVDLVEILIGACNYHYDSGYV